MQGTVQVNQRATTRHKARLFVKIRNGMRVESGMVSDLSMQGMGVVMHNTRDQKPGDFVEIHNEKIGYVNGYVRWVKPDCIGIELDLTSNNAAKIAAFFRYFNG